MNLAEMLSPEVRSQNITGQTREVRSHRSDSEKQDFGNAVLLSLPCYNDRTKKLRAT